MLYRINRLGRDEPNVDSLESCQVPATHSPEAIDDTFETSERALAELGFSFAEWYLLNDQVNGGVGTLALFRHASGVALARLWRRSVPGTDRLCEPAEVIFVSVFEDDSFLVSTAGRSDMATPPGMVINQLVGASAMELWRSHLQKLASRPDRQVRRMESLEEASAVLQRHHEAVRDFYLRHGIFQPPDPDDSAAVAEVVQPPGVSDHAPVLAEIDRLQNKRPGWLNAILILGVSLLLFFALGAAAWSWRGVLMLVPILLFHELGHYVAMRLFGYRNLRMFFIPLFGAAVSGRHYNVPGWKKAIVSFAGPLPGMAMGIAIGIGAVVADQRWLLEFSVLMLVLNGLNLLPFLPLDGGWVAHAILFSRNPALDAGFRVVAAIALIAGGLALRMLPGESGVGTVFLSLLGVFMLFGVPMAFRMARVSLMVRRESIAAIASDDQIPTEAACRIIELLHEMMPRGISPKQMARTTLQVFENANARPPGWLATIGFGVVQAGCFLTCLVFPIVLMAAHQIGIGNLFSPPGEMQMRPLAVEQIRSVETPEGDLSTSDEYVTVLATFPTAEAAEQTFDTMVEQPSGFGRIKLIGQTLLVDFSEGAAQARTSSIDQLRSRSAEVGVSREQFDSTFALECVAPNRQVAEAIQEQVSQYFTMPWGMHAIPPWSPEFSLSDQHVKARRTFQRLTRGPSVNDDERLQQIDEEYGEVGEDDARFAQLDEQYEQRVSELNEQFREQLRSEGKEQVDIHLIDLYDRIPQYQDVADASEIEATKAYEEYTEKIRQWNLEIGARVGQLPVVDGAVQPGAARYSGTGYVEVEGLRLNFSNVSFARVFDGPQSLAEWLHGQGCADFQYGVFALGEED